MKNPRKDDPRAHYALGVNLHKLGKLGEALLEYKKALRSAPDFLEAHLRIGDILIAQNKVGEVELRYKRILSLKPDLADAWYNLGMAQQKLGKLDEAAQSYRKAIDLKSAYTIVAMNNLGQTLDKRGQHEEAGRLFEAAIALNPDLPLSRYNLATWLRERGELEKAAWEYTKTLTLKPDYIEASINLRDILNTPMVMPLEVALDSYKKAPSTLFLEIILTFAYNACNWGVVEEYESRLLAAAREGKDRVNPWTLLRSPATNADLLLAAQTYNAWASAQNTPFSHTPQPGKKKINIGYFSADLREHATAYLMIDLFERHDRERFKTFAYSLHAGEESPMHTRIKAAFDSFVPVGGLSDDEIAKKMRDDDIDILVDLHAGMTAGGRLSVMAKRPAPIQVNYIGHPGTSGTDFIDYIIADRFIVPEEHERFYSEKVVCLPDTYQPNDRKRILPDETPSRKDCDLPDDGFVFCSFNNAYKITPEFFDIWMRLLKAVPDSVLWLLDANRLVRDNLKAEAEKRGVDSSRLRFAPRVGQLQHLTRQRHAGLILDNLPVCAHTTTSDAIWAGTPIITCVGDTFAGRVAGSVLTAANLPELITPSLEDYEALALRLAQNPAELAALKKKIADTRLSMPLFNSERFTKNIEKAYQRMYDLWQAGEAPQAFTVEGNPAS